MNTSRDVSKISYFFMLFFISAVILVPLFGTPKRIISSFGGSEMNSVGDAVRISVFIEEKIHPNHRIVVTVENIQFIEGILPIDMGDSIENACVRGVYLEVKSNEYFSAGSSTNLTAPFCKKDSVEFSMLGNPIIQDEYSVYNLESYPYDDVSFIIDLRVIIGDSSDPVSVSSVIYTTEALDRMITVSSKSSKVITLKRSILHRYLLPLFLICIFMVIFALPKIDELGAFVEVSIAIIFGLWGTRQLMVPFETQEPILLDLILLLLYSLLLIPVIIKVLSFLFNRPIYDEYHSDELLEEMLDIQKDRYHRPLRSPRNVRRNSRVYDEDYDELLEEILDTQKDRYRRPLRSPQNARRNSRVYDED